jgi:hypothetical protein
MPPSSRQHSLCSRTHAERFSWPLASFRELEPENLAYPNPFITVLIVKWFDASESVMGKKVTVTEFLGYIELPISRVTGLQRRIA